MTNDEERRTNPTDEANIFAISPTGYKVHFKLTFPEAAGVLTGLNNLEKLIEALSAKGYRPDSMGAAVSGAAPAAQPAPLPQGGGGANNAAKPDGCDLCGSGAIVAVKKFNDKSPDFRCSSCDAAAWGPRKDGEYTWKASTR